MARAKTEDTKKEITLPCDHAACRITSYSDGAKAFKQMTVAHRLTVMRSSMYATTAALDLKELFRKKQYIHHLLKRRKRHEGSRDKNEFKSRKMLYAVQNKRFSNSASARLTIISE